MKAHLTVLGLLLVAPWLASAATFAEDKTLIVDNPVPGNAYLAGTTVTVRTTLPADLAAAGGTVNVLAPVAGDVLIAGGTIDLEDAVEGDVRLAGGKVVVNGPVSGDVVAAGGRVEVRGIARDMRIAGATVSVTGGATGPVTIYGADIMVAGEYQGDVEIIASDRFVLAEGTRIHGVLRYNAPQQVEVPASAVIDGGVTYTGSYSYVPTSAEAQRFALFGAGLFFLVRALSLMIAAGLLAGLFPVFTTMLAERTLAASARRMSLLALLGFALLVATPVLVLFLLVSFVGGAVALLLGFAYLCALILAYLCAGILVGGAIRERLLRRPTNGVITWKDALLGMLVFFLLSSIPFIGWALTLVFMCLSLGALAAAFYASAFGRTSGDDEL